MGRVNIEDSIYRDERFFNLSVLLGSRELALGALCFAWDLAQRCAHTPSGLIPLSDWDKLKFHSEIQSSGFAEHRDGGVYVRGSGKHCAFIRDVYEKRRAAGKKGGLKFKENLQSKIEQNRAKETLSPSPSPSFSDSPSKKKNISSERFDKRCGAAFPFFESLNQVFEERKVTDAVQARWKEAFPDPPWIVGEIKKALAWEEANPTRKKKRFAAFITNWLNRSWDRRGTSGSPRSRDYSFLEAGEET